MPDDNGLNAVADLDNTGAVVDRYVYGLDDHVPALLLRGTSTYRLITDQLGSVRGVVDVSSGAVVQQTDYDAWGVATVVSGGSFQAVGYAGGLTDASTGLVRFGARDYDPSVGRWTAKDPILLTAGSNAYRYVYDSPVASIDPSGLCTLQIGLSVSYIFPFRGIVNASTGFAIDDRGHIAGYLTLPLGGVGVGAGASGGVTIAVSDAETVKSLKGPFLNVGGSGSGGLSVTGEYFQGDDTENPGLVVHGASITVGGGAGGGAAAYGTTTHISPSLTGDAPSRGRTAPR